MLVLYKLRDFDCKHLRGRVETAPPNALRIDLLKGLGLQAPRAPST